MGPAFMEIGGKGIALTIVFFTFIIFLSSGIVIVEIKLTIIWLDLNFKFLIMALPTSGVTAKKIQLQFSIIFWFDFSTTILLNFFFKFLEILLFREEIQIFLNEIFDLKIPEMTDDVIFPVPIKPKFIVKIIMFLLLQSIKKKTGILLGYRSKFFTLL